MTNNIKLQEVCKQLHIPVVGTTSWPLPNEARQILCESNPCPFTAADLDERLMGTPDFMPRSAIVCLFPYHVPYRGATNLARYTWATDYHLVVTDYLQRLVDELSSTNPSELFSIHCDTSPLADRYMAYLAGLGFYGKNKCFINPNWGSYIVIGTVLTTLEFEPNTPITETCLGCNRCISACLGKCLDHNEFKYDTCKSYLAQKKGDLTDDEQSIVGKSPLVFGCDVCQEVCPHNKDLPTTPIVEFQSIEPYVDIEELESISNKEFKAKYGHRAFSWRGKKILIRNNKYINSKTLQQK
ncbi:epoxyqueuosine reductase [Veillonella tobetsuensis]